MTLVATARLTSHGIEQVGFLPAYINRNAQPEILGAADPRFGEVVQYLERISAQAGLRVQYRCEGDRVYVHANAEIAPV